MEPITTPELLLLHFAAEHERKRDPTLFDLSDLGAVDLYNLARIPMDVELDDLSVLERIRKEKTDGPLGNNTGSCSSQEPGLRPMKAERVEQIVEHAVEVIKEVLKEILVGEEEKHDETRDPEQTRGDTPKHHQDLA